jgi:transcriptional regulator with XRE-family HTH domain
MYRKMVISEGASARLKEERKRIGMSQTEFATSAGVSRGAQVAYESGATYPDVAYLARIEQNGVDVGYVLSGRHGGDIPAGHVQISRIPEFGGFDIPESVLLPEFLLRRKIGLTPIEHVRWVLNPSSAMEPVIEQHAVVLVDVSKAGHAAVLDGLTYAYLLSGRPDVRRILIRSDHWSVAGPGKGGDYRDVYESDLGELKVLGAVIGAF